MSRLPVPSWPSVLATAEARKERTAVASETRGSCIWDAPGATRAAPGDWPGSRGAACGARGSLPFLEPCSERHYYRPWPFPFLCTTKWKIKIKKSVICCHSQNSSCGSQKLSWKATERSWGRLCTMTRFKGKAEPCQYSVVQKSPIRKRHFSFALPEAVPKCSTASFPDPLPFTVVTETQ